MVSLLELRRDLLIWKSDMAAIKRDLRFRRLMQANYKAGFNPDQPRDDEGRWSNGGVGSSFNSSSSVSATLVEENAGDARYAALVSETGDVLSDALPEPIIPNARYAAANVVRNDRTGDPMIDRTTDRLVQTSDAVSEDIGPGAGPAYGTLVHGHFGQSVKAQNLPGIGTSGVEQSFSLYDVVRYGLDGSIRTDVVLRDPNGTPIAVWDVKTGGAQLSGPRVREIRKYLGVGSEVPVIELHVTRGISNKMRAHRISCTTMAYPYGNWT